MRLWSDTFSAGGALPAACAFAQVDAVSHVRWSGNRNPHLAWDEVPAGTESLLLFCIDGDAPCGSAGAAANQPYLTLAPTLPRDDFYHWTLADIPLALTTLDEGLLSDGVTPRGKGHASATVCVRDGTEHLLRQGINDYTDWYSGDPTMAGDYYGYDGPCPPRNDLRLHHYIFRIYALDVPRLALLERFTGPDAMAAMRGHLLDEAQIIGTYTLNPALTPAASSGRRRV